MFPRPNLNRTLVLVLFGTSLCAGSSVYVVTGNQQFGTIDLNTGAFNQVGPSMPEPTTGLAEAPNGSLLTLTVSGNLDSINPVTGVTTLIGPTGLGDCTTSASPCGPNSADTIARFGQTFYATDLANNLYTVNPVTGVATLKGPTGIPPLPFTLLATNPDGSFNAVNQALFGAGGKLYATFEAITVNFTTDPVAINIVTPSVLYEIDSGTGLATIVGPTTRSLSTAVEVDGTVYTFSAATNQLLTLNVSNGQTNFVADIDPSLGPISAAVPTPEPSSAILAGLGLAVAAAMRLRRVKI